MNRRLSGWDGPLSGPKNGQTTNGAASKTTGAAGASAAASKDGTAPALNSKRLSTVSEILATTPVPAATGAALTDAAQFTRLPSDKEMALLDGWMTECLEKKPEDPEDFAMVIESALLYYGIDTSHVAKVEIDDDGGVVTEPSIQYDPDLEAEGADGLTDGNRCIRISRTAFESGPTSLAAILAHEVTHANQLMRCEQALKPGETLQDTEQRHAAFELMAYQATVREGMKAKPTLSEAQVAVCNHQIQIFWSILSEENKELYRRGDYFNVK